MWADPDGLPDTLTANDIDAMDPDTLAQILEGFDLDSLRDAAREYEEAGLLEVSRLTVFKVLLSTGGPADWLEIACEGDTPRYQPLEGAGEYLEPVRITYVFQDWYDGARRELTGREFEIAAAYASRVVPELVDY